MSRIHAEWELSSRSTASTTPEAAWFSRNIIYLDSLSVLLGPVNRMCVPAYSLSLFLSLSGQLSVPSTLQCHWIDDPNISHSPYVTFHYAAISRRVNTTRASKASLFSSTEYALPVASCWLSHRPISRNDDDRVEKFPSDSVRGDFNEKNSLYANCRSRNWLSSPRKMKGK